MAIATVTSSASAARSNTMGMEDFLKILLTQLTYQDPLKPMDNQEFMAQMAQFTSLEQTQQTNEKLSLLVANQAALQSVGLIGRTVEIALSEGKTVSGTVSALSFSGDSPGLSVTTPSGGTLDGINLGQIVSVH